jgi:EAL domain-containing protein (putative c-di-GMP-specific phosphodiesterase class I)
MVLNEACVQAARWRADTLSDFTISVNVSGQQLYDDDFVNDVEDALRSAGLPATCLILELTESTLLSDTSAVHQRLEQLKQLGVRLAIDDFGTGYSSLSYLHSFPVDYLKIDRSFVKSLNRADDHQSHVMIRSIVSIAQNMNLGVVAEGIEDAVQLEALLEAGCNTGQGFLLARPLPPEEVAAFIAAKAAMQKR